MTSRINILTIDLEEWFNIHTNKALVNIDTWERLESRIESNTEILLNILEKNNVRGTFFVLGWIAKNYPDLVRKIHTAGHGIGSHSNIHNLVSSLDQSEFEADLKQSIDTIENAIGKKVKSFRAPSFSIGKYNLWAFESLIKNGIEIDCSVFPARRDIGGFRELASLKEPFLLKYGTAQLMEFPMSTLNILGNNFAITGGGYFRLSPYFIIKKFMKSSPYNMTYFHPRDFDIGQPVLEGVKGISRFKSYVGIRKALDKFDKLLGDFDFLNITEAETMIDWSKVDVVDVESLR